MQKVQILLIDDVDGGEADETVTFGLDNSRFEIDLSKKNAAELREVLGRYVRAGRRAGGRDRPARGGTPGGRRGGGAAGEARSSAAGSGGDQAISPRDVRAWANRNGVPVSERGRVSADVIARYREATQ